MNTHEQQTRPRVLVGEITGVFGIRGEVRMMPRIERPEILPTIDPIIFQLPDGREIIRTVEKVRRQRQAALLTISGVISRNDAETLRGSLLLVDRENLPLLEPDTYYECDLLGLRVVTEVGDDLGVVERVHFNPAANDVYETSLAMIPAVGERIERISLDEKLIVVRDIPGLRKSD